MGWLRPRRRWWRECRLWPAVVGVRPGQGDGEAAARAGRALQLDTPAVKRGQVAHEREPQADAVVGAIELPINLRERSEQPL